MLFIRLFTFLLLLPAMASAQLGLAITGGRHKVKFPIEIVNNLVIVPVVLNGQLPLKFILDTGVRTTILTERSFSDLLKLTYGRHYMVAGPGGDKVVEAYVTNNVTLDLPGLHGEGHAMLVLEKDYLELRNYLGTDVQGVLGYEIFSRFIVQIDYKEKEVTIILPEYFQAGKRYEAIPMHVEDTKPYIQGSVQMSDGTVVSTKLLVDSGASHGLVLDPSSDKQIFIPEKNVQSLIGRGLGGLITGKIGRIQGVTIGKFTIENPIVNFPDANSYIDTLKSTDIFRNGTLGGEILSRFTTIYDFPREKLYLKKNSSFSNAFHFNMSGLTLKAKGSRLRKYEVTDVRKGSPADKADIRNGDELVSINGVLARDLELARVNGEFNQKPGKKIKVELIRNGEKLTRHFALESQI
jgi:hypothetical protein